MGSAVATLKTCTRDCRKDQGRLEDAVVLYTEAVRVSPKDPTFIFNLAQVGHVRIHKWIHAAVDGRADGFEDGVL